MFSLKGKVTLVTGANSGLGLGFAEGIAGAGGDVVIWGRRADSNAAARARIARHGTRVIAQEVDVGDAASVRAAFDDAVAQMGQIDGVVANAGISSAAPSFDAMSDETYHELVAINQHGAFYTLRAALGHMRARFEAGGTGGSIVTCGSLACVAGVPRNPHYAASKGALMAMTRTIAVEYGDRGIRANMILPGRIATNLGNRGKEDPEVTARRAAAVPIPRIGTPADCAGLVVYLLSDAASYHTGSVIPVDGGLSIALR
jgi:NAD(P)-dependent dehydrogenase (short-subunit alcohol dehydrogenase family)